MNYCVVIDIYYHPVAFVWRTLVEKTIFNTFLGLIIALKISYKYRIIQACK